MENFDAPTFLDVIAFLWEHGTSTSLLVGAAGMALVGAGLLGSRRRQPADPAVISTGEVPR